MGWGSRKKRGGLLPDGGLVQIHAKGPRRARLSTCSRYPGTAARQVPRRAPGLTTAVDLRRSRAWLKTMGAEPVTGYSGTWRALYWVRPSAKMVLHTHCAAGVVADNARYGQVRTSDLTGTAYSCSGSGRQ